MTKKAKRSGGLKGVSMHEVESHHTLSIFRLILAEDFPLFG